LEIDSKKITKEKNALNPRRVLEKEQKSIKRRKNLGFIGDSGTVRREEKVPYQEERN